MTDPNLSEDDRLLLEMAVKRHPGYAFEAVPIFAGFISPGGSPPFASHYIATTNTRSGECQAYHHGSIADSLKLAELDLAGVESIEGGIRYLPEAVTSLLSDSLKAQGWRCVEASYRVKHPWNSYTIVLQGAGRTRVVIVDYARDVLDILEDAIWCAETGNPGWELT